MESPIKVYVVGDATEYVNFINNAVICKKLSDAQIVLFTGGEDVSPSLYGCTPHSTTHSNLQRDLREKEIFEKVSPNQLCVGVCRGSQFLCVMNGGLLVQDVGYHGVFGTHAIYNEVNQFEITSTHHQMQYPYNLLQEDYEVLYRSLESDHYDGDKIDPRVIQRRGEPEIVLYHVQGKPKCLAIQGHPEIMPNDCGIVLEINKIINSLINE